jgi:hypothetical protein
MQGMHVILKHLEAGLDQTVSLVVSSSLKVWLMSSSAIYLLRQSPAMRI